LSFVLFAKSLQLLYSNVHQSRTIHTSLFPSVENNSHFTLPLPLPSSHFPLHTSPSLFTLPSSHFPLHTSPSPSLFTLPSSHFPLHTSLFTLPLPSSHFPLHTYPSPSPVHQVGNIQGICALDTFLSWEKFLLTGNVFCIFNFIY
jgi:hypothetical protein